MELSLSTWMMIAFIVGLGLSVWKMYPFLVTRQLEDDDTTPEAQHELLEFVLKILKNFEKAPNEQELHKRVVEHEAFNKKRFWRFNQNKLRQMLHLHFLEHDDVTTIEELHKKLKSS